MPRSPERGWPRRVGIFVAFAALIFIAWEGVKLIGGDPWRGEGWTWEPPLEIWFASDLLLPHVWDVVGALAALRPGGRMAVISYHSLEDRIVKRFVARESRDCIEDPLPPVCTCGHRAQLRAVVKGVITAGPEEVQRNRRARSAKLRVAEKLA